jgi:hypothetical protein
MGSGCSRTAGTGGPSCTRTPAMRRDSGAGPRSRRAVGVGVYRRPRLQRAHAGLKCSARRFHPRRSGSSWSTSVAGAPHRQQVRPCRANTCRLIACQRLPRVEGSPRAVCPIGSAPVVPLWYRMHRPMSPERPGAWTWGAQWTLRDGSARPIEPGSGLARSIRGNVGSDGGSSLGLFRPLRRGSRRPIAG